MENRWVKGVLTVLGAVMLSTAGIFASDVLQGINPSIGNLAGVGGANACAEGAVPLKTDLGILCVDMFEASPSKGCPSGDPGSVIDSERNAASVNCYAASVFGAKPWTNISLPQAQRMCSSAGKRLPRPDEWYRIALGTNAESCAVKTSAVTKTGNTGCVSDIGAYDTVGNVWEWIDATISDGTYEGRSLPPEGYVTSVDADGVAITAGPNPDFLYGDDYIWTSGEGVLGMIRGGFYNSGSDAGLYAVNVSITTSLATQGIGFRCVKDAL